VPRTLHQPVRPPGIGEWQHLADDGLEAPLREQRPHLRFQLTPPMADAFRAGQPAVITLDHPNYHARAELPRAQAAEIAKDLGAV